MRVEIWSDIVCPYCYMGKRIFEAALKKSSHASDIEVIWRSYQLDPTLASGEKIDFYQYMADMEGVSREEAIAEAKEVAAKAKKLGLIYNFDKVVMTNTFDAHRLIHLASKHKIAGLAEEKLHKAYFTDGLDVSDKNVLLNIGKEIGLDENEVLQLLNSDAVNEEVYNDIEEANSLNLYYVPFFLFNRKHIITGIVSEEDFLKVLNI